MDIFSDILAKSRFEQQAVKGNFLPRRDPKDNTTSNNEDENSSEIILTKESPIQGPGIPTKTSEPSKEVVGRGKKAARSREADASVPDNSTYVVGMEKSDRTIQRAKREAQTTRRDKAQKEMYEGTAGRQLKPGDPVKPRKRQSHMDRERPEPISDRIKALTAADPKTIDSIRRMRRA